MAVFEKYKKLSWGNLQRAIMVLHLNQLMILEQIHWIVPSNLNRRYDIQIETEEGLKTVGDSGYHVEEKQNNKDLRVSKRYSLV